MKEGIKMNYEEAKLHKQELERISDIYGDKLNSFERGELGVAPDHVRALPEWKEAKISFDKAFTELQKFNIYFTKTFKKEYLKERDEKRRKLQRA